MSPAFPSAAQGACLQGSSREQPGNLRRLPRSQGVSSEKASQRLRPSRRSRLPALRRFLEAIVYIPTIHEEVPGTVSQAPSRTARTSSG